MNVSFEMEKYDFFAQSRKKSPRPCFFSGRELCKLLIMKNSVVSKTIFAKSCRGVNFSTTAELLTLHLRMKCVCGGWLLAYEIFTDLSSFSQAAKLKAPQKDFFI